MGFSVRSSNLSKMSIRTPATEVSAYQAQSTAPSCGWERNAASWRATLAREFRGGWVVLGRGRLAKVMPRPAVVPDDVTNGASVVAPHCVQHFDAIVKESSEAEGSCLAAFPAQSCYAPHKQDVLQGVTLVRP